MAAFTTLSEIRAILRDLPSASDRARAEAIERNAQLTKPPAALGRLEDLAVWYAAWRNDPRPSVNNPQVIVFAGNHGVTAQGVSAFPAEVTQQMVWNFEAGGAAINQLAKCFGASMNVVSLDLEVPTADFTEGPAMSEAEVVAALAAGWDAVSDQADVLVVGEMGIGNTTSAASIAHALFGGAGEDWVGRGTGVDDPGLARKAAVVAKAVAVNSDPDPLEILRSLGGRELAAMAGAILRARHLSVPVLLDGFICSAAAATLETCQPGALDHCVAGHVSAEQAHARLLENIGKEPLLALNMRLGEASGGALAIGILKAAVACHSGMATFAEAGVADGA